MVRTALLAGAVAVIVTASWARLELSRPSLVELVGIAVLAVAPALLRGRMRLVGATLATMVAGSVALEVPLRRLSPFDGRDFVASLVGRTWDGFLDFYDVTVPFDGIAQPLMHGAMLMAAFAFSLAAALAIAARRPPLALAALVLGAGWPATILPGDNQLLRGVLILVVGLVLLAAVQPGKIRARSQVLAGAAVVALALGLSTSGAVAKSQFVDWQSWDPYNQPDAPVGVSYVWQANYDGVKFPNKRTRVLRVRGRGAYWRATTLDAYFDRRWDEEPIVIAPPAGGWGPRANLSGDPLLPDAARNEDNWERIDVTIEALRDFHLVGASVPVMYDTRDLPTPQYMAGGIAELPRTTDRGDEYSVWNFASRPKPAALARSKPNYPFDLQEAYLSIERGLRPPPFGAPDRGAWFEELLDFDPEVIAHKPLFDQARAQVGSASNPYAAVVALEAWFRTGGGFRYDETPRIAPPDTPPLVYFVTESKEGYCQHYAGAMALMLRYLGIPARVAAGFTSGIYDSERRVWTVNDRNAHTWVEVWFEGFGWLPFDPTPGRGNLSGAYSASSFSFDALGARDVLTAAGLVGAERLLRFQLERDRDGSTGTPFTPRDFQRAPENTEGGGGIGPTAIVLFALVGASLLLVGAKLARRRGRYLTRDPRRVAQACRRELVEFLADQRIDVPVSATLDELRELVVRQTGVDSRRLVAALGIARFGHAEGAALAAQRARGELRLVRRRLRQALSTGARFRGALSIRSLVLR